MFKGEGTATSPDPFHVFPQKSDRGDVSPARSQYSSCGESDLERYCSANSNIGTPSMCSSFSVFHECLDSDLGSLKSFALGETGSLENFSLEGTMDRRREEESRLSSSARFDSFKDHRLAASEGKIDDGPGMHVGCPEYGESSFFSEDDVAVNSDMSSPKIGNEPMLPRVVDFDTGSGESVYGKHGSENIVLWREHGKSEMLQSAGQNAFNQRTIDAGNVETEFENGARIMEASVESNPPEYFVSQQIESGFDDIDSKSNVQLDEEEAVSLSGEDEASTRYGHSDGEDSMYNCGSDDEDNFNLHLMEGRVDCQDDKMENENPLAMNSSTAFGSDDWDDFAQETWDSDLSSLLMRNFQVKEQEDFETERKIKISTSIGELEKREHGSVINLPSPKEKGTNESNEFLMSSSLVSADVPDSSELEYGNVKNIPEINNQLRSTDDSAECLETCTVSNIFEADQAPLMQEAPLQTGLNTTDSNCQYKRPEKVIDFEVIQSSENELVGNSTSEFGPLSNITATQGSLSTEALENKVELVEDATPNCFGSVLKNTNSQLESKDSIKSESQPESSKTDDIYLNQFYDEFVHEMEEILLDAEESSGHMLRQGNKMLQPHFYAPSRDGGSTASTSGTNDCYLPLQGSLRIDGIDVVGAKQKEGDVSLSERLVGVKEFTVYVVRVWSGKAQWDVERRYRDFFTLYRRLKSAYAQQGWNLPPPWSSVEKDSRKMFGSSSPAVIAQRSSLIQECLQSILQYRCSPSLPKALICFLSPQKEVPTSPVSNSSPFTFFAQDTKGEAAPTLGKTVALIVEILPHKSIKQLSETQQYSCAGCHRYFDDCQTRIGELVRTFGWGKPRLCEYTGQLFCTSCHTNETAVLPARVLHHWDFSQYPVSQLAKSYLDSINDQPMLCVSAVNPLLFTKVPALLHVMGVRKKIAAILPNVRCPFRRSINKCLGSRIYLLESNGFFALRDLIDLSKGAFAALPVMIETVLKKILEHITEQCLICCDMGCPCGARQACDDPSSLIFPFQEEEVNKCTSCDLVFHRHCFERLTNCVCGAHLNADADEIVKIASKASQKRGSNTENTSDLVESSQNSKSNAGFFAELFSRSGQKKTWGAKDGDTVILMGSFPPNTSL